MLSSFLGLSASPHAPAAESSHHEPGGSFGTGRGRGGRGRGRGRGGRGRGGAGSAAPKAAPSDPGVAVHAKFAPVPADKSSSARIPRAADAPGELAGAPWGSDAEDSDRDDDDATGRDADDWEAALDAGSDAEPNFEPDSLSMDECGSEPEEPQPRGGRRGFGHPAPADATRLLGRRAAAAAAAAAERPMYTGPMLCYDTDDDDGW